MQLNWVKCLGDLWCPFGTVNLTNVRTPGVYVIWKPGNTFLTPSHAVRVGQGNIADRLRAHRDDYDIIQYGSGLLVTWASVASEIDRDGIERYLGQQLQPLVGSRYPDAVPIPVNLPIAA